MSFCVSFHYGILTSFAEATVIFLIIFKFMLNRLSSSSDLNKIPSLLYWYVIKLSTRRVHEHFANHTRKKNNTKIREKVKKVLSKPFIAFVIFIISTELYWIIWIYCIKVHETIELLTFSKRQSNVLIHSTD